MERWTRFVLHHRFFVLTTWVVAFVVAGTASAQLSELLTNRFTLPGTDSQRAERILQDHFGQQSTGSFTLVVESDGAGVAALLPEARAAAARATSELPTGRLVSVAPLSSSVVAAQIVSELEPADAKGSTAAMRRAAGAISGATLYLTGQAATAHDLDPVFSRSLLVPSAMKLSGHYNWWLPEGVARIVRVAPSPLGEHSPVLNANPRP